MKYSKQTLAEMKAYIRQQIANDAKQMEYFLIKNNPSNLIKDGLAEIAKDIRMYIGVLEILENTEAE